MTTLNEDQIRLIAQLAKEELGAAATLEKLREVVRQTVAKLEKSKLLPRLDPKGHLLAICISLDGLKNSRVLSEALKESKCKISERFERKMTPFHILAAVIDYRACLETFETIKMKLAEEGNATGVRIVLLTEDTLKSFSNQ